MDLPFALEGLFIEKVNGSAGQRVTFTIHYIIYAPASRHTAAKAPFPLLPFAALHLDGCWVYVGGPRNCLLDG